MEKNPWTNTDRKQPNSNTNKPKVNQKPPIGRSTNTNRGGRTNQESDKNRSQYSGSEKKPNAESNTYKPRGRGKIILNRTVDKPVNAYSQSEDHKKLLAENEKIARINQEKMLIRLQKEREQKDYEEQEIIKIIKEKYDQVAEEYKITFEVFVYQNFERGEREYHRRLRNSKIASENEQSSGLVKTSTKAKPIVDVPKVASSVPLTKEKNLQKKKQSHDDKEFQSVKRRGAGHQKTEVEDKDFEKRLMEKTYLENKKRNSKKN